MRINNPQLFNGEILASQDWIANQLNGIFGDKFTYIKETETLSGALYASDILMSAEIDAKDIAAKIAEVEASISGLQNSLTTNVKLVTGGGLTRVDGEGGGLKVVASDFITLTANSNPSGELSGFASVYTIEAGDQTLNINIPKDQFLKTAEFYADATNVPTKITDRPASFPAIRFEFSVSDDGVETTQTPVWVEVSGLVDIYTAGSGITLSGNEFSLVADETADTTKYLVIGKNTIGLKGIETAIADAVGTETTNREAAIKTLSDAIGEGYSSASTVKAAIEANATAISTETANREAADKALTTRIDAIDNATSGTVAGLAGRVVEIEGTIAGYTSTDTISGAITAAAETAAQATANAAATAAANLKAATNDIGARAVQFWEKPFKFGGGEGETGTIAEITGKVIAVYTTDADGFVEQCYPTVKYNATSGISRLSADSSEAETFTVVYSTPLGAIPSAVVNA